ncbi:type II toxin-antitoxin system VapC family toxin [Synoicihabitans lomoniglobus]|uniref:Type II toxin-antitoxin system VapC family toxin n=1 Tax=Synoicihabitans lomoniglobus TaxID=2909285 RepID=A0AAF0CMP2_9BACT|nr:type II toxin-antitoxin system VapC family toxin [Opitutaceae bacterium LMO-M01]WED63320.1 type II toxin-antitoxin system VapC family toxin [Opitutaceae bacterium LMO-M01]
MPASPHVVLDSFALITYLRDQPGADHVEQLMQEAATQQRTLWMTKVNYAEVHDMLVREEGAKIWTDCEAAIDGLPIRFVSADRSLANRAAQFKAAHKLSLADAFSAALAQTLDALLVTGDPEFTPLAEEIKIDWLN